MRKNIRMSNQLLRNLRVEAAKNDTTITALVGEILQNFLEQDVPIVTPDPDWKNHLLHVDEVVWEQVRSEASRLGVTVYVAFDSSATSLGYLTPTAV